MRMWMMAGATLMALASTSAVAKDRSGYHAISTGSLTEAEATLQAERAIFPNRPELMLNMAAVYVRTGRLHQARGLYSEVLERDAVAMEMPDGSIRSSHDVARSGLAYASATVAAR